MLLFVFSFTLKLFPVAGDRGFASLVLPALSLPRRAVIGRVLRQGIERALDEPYALTVRSWGSAGSRCACAMRCATRRCRPSRSPAGSWAGC